MTNAEKLDLVLSILIENRNNSHYLEVNDIVLASSGRLEEEEVMNFLVCLYKDGNISFKTTNYKSFFNHQGEAFLKEKGGYVEQENLRIKSIRQANKSFLLATYTFWVSVVALVVAILSLIKQCSTK